MCCFRNAKKILFYATAKRLQVFAMILFLTEKMQDARISITVSNADEQNTNSLEISSLCNGLWKITNKQYAHFYANHFLFAIFFYKCDSLSIFFQKSNAVFCFNTNYRRKTGYRRTKNKVERTVSN